MTNNDRITQLQASGWLNNIPKWGPPPNDRAWPKSTGNQLEDYDYDTLIEAQSQCQTDNDNAIDLYYHRVDAFYRSNTAGKTPALGFPTVPNAEAVVDAGDGTFTVAPGAGLPVCNPLPVPDDHTQSMQQRFDSVPLGTVDIGAAFEAGEQFGFFHLGPNNRTPYNAPPVQGRSLDGVIGTFSRVRALAGQWTGPLANYSGYYERVQQ